MQIQTNQETLAYLADLLQNFNGREYSGPIGPETLFFSELGMMSIDAVVLGETVETHFGQRFPFPKFLASLAQRGADDLSVGELADFLAANLHSK
jgi:acyl carrier protein